jgi:hypothetical protein
MQNGRSSDNGSSSMGGESGARPSTPVTNGTGKGKGKSEDWWNGNLKGYEQHVKDLVEVYLEVLYPM